MTNLEEVIALIEQMLKNEGGIENDMYNLLTTIYADPDARVKTLIYLASLEFLKLKAKYEDTGQFMHLHGPLASSIHTLLDIIYRDDVGKMVFTIDRVKEGIIEEAQEKTGSKPKPENLDDFLKRWK